MFQTAHFEKDDMSEIHRDLGHLGLFSSGRVEGEDDQDQRGRHVGDTAQICKRMRCLIVGANKGG